MIRKINESCFVAWALDVVGERWSLLIIRDALNGISRFNEFERSIGLAKNILSLRLRTLVEHRILCIIPASDGSVYNEYILTEKGKKLLPIINALNEWGSEFMFSSGF